MTPIDRESVGGWIRCSPDGFETRHGADMRALKLGLDDWRTEYGEDGRWYLLVREGVSRD